MADKKITELTELLLPQYNAILPLIADPLGIPLNRYSTLLNLLGGVKNAKMYGVVGDGVTDDSAAMQALLDLGGNIYFPPGTYIVGTKLNYNSNTFLMGAGRGITIFKCKAGANLGTIFDPNTGSQDTPVSNVTMAHFSMDGSKDGTQTGANEGLYFHANYMGFLYDLEAYNCEEAGIIPQGGMPTNRMENVIFISNCFSHDNVSDGFQGANCVYQGCWTYNNSVGFNVNLNGATHDPTIPSSTHYIGCRAIGNTAGFLFNYAFSAENKMEIFVQNCLATKSTSYGLVSSVEKTIISNSHFTNNADYGLALFNTRNSKVIGNVIANNGTVGGSYNVGMYTSGYWINSIIALNHFYDDQTVATQKYGIDYNSYDATGHDNKIINNTFEGHVTGPINPDFYTHANLLDYEIRGNTGLNPVGLSAISVGSSPYTYTAHAIPETIYITGGTVSSITKGGTQIATTSPCTINLEPFQSIIVTYSVTPTMIKDKQ